MIDCYWYCDGVVGTMTIGIVTDDIGGDGGREVMTVLTLLVLVVIRDIIVDDPMTVVIGICG